MNSRKLRAMTCDKDTTAGRGQGGFFMCVFSYCRVLLQIWEEYTLPLRQV